MIGEHLQVTCFASCYAAALVCEILRLALQGPARRRLALILAGVGLALHTLFLVARGMGPSGGLPISTLFESLVLFAWLLALVYFYLAYRRHQWAVGVFVLPVILVVLVVAGVFLGSGPRQDEAIHKLWGAVHGVMLLIGSGAVTGAFVAGLMYLVQARRLKAKARPVDGMGLPNLEKLERFNSHMVNLGFPLLTVGIAIGVLLNLPAVRGSGGIMSWVDPKLVATALCWAVFGFLLHARYSPHLRGRKVAYLTVVAFLFMLFALFGVELLLGTRHVGMEGGG
jgi:ABC-type transport system involved in cytochrome c biogenesis permease subunit